MQAKIRKRYIHFCQEHEGYGILPYLQVNKLVCLDFMDVERRHKDSWDRDKDSLFLTAISVAKASSFVCVGGEHNLKNQMVAT